MSRVVAKCLAIASLLAAVASASKVTNFVGNRTTIVHLFEWKWDDIADECRRFLGPMGYAGIQVSPIQENLVLSGRPWYERYQPISYRWETRSGDEQQFRSMVRACNEAGVRIYVDVLLNHMSGNGANATGTGGSRASPHELDYPAVPYNASHFHPLCSINNWRDVNQIRNCELVGLHDLDQAQPYVRDQMVELLNRAVDAGVAGFRVDAAKHMWPKDLEAIYSRVKNLSVAEGFAPGTRPFIFQEVIDYGGDVISRYEYSHLGAVTEFKAGREISNAVMGSNSLHWFVSWGEGWSLMPSKDALVFIDNHDTQREANNPPLTYKNPRLYKVAVAFMLAHPYGHPQVMSSFEFDNFEKGPPAEGPSINEDGSCGGGWVCEHRWRQIYNMVGLRNLAGDEPLTDWWDNGANQIAFCRGSRAFVAINVDSVHLSRRLRVCLPAGTYCDVISGDVAGSGCTGKSIRVDDQGYADVSIRTDDNDAVVAFHQNARVA